MKKGRGVTKAMTRLRKVRSKKVKEGIYIHVRKKSRRKKKK